MGLRAGAGGAGVVEERPVLQRGGSFLSLLNLPPQRRGGALLPGPLLLCLERSLSSVSSRLSLPLREAPKGTTPSPTQQLQLVGFSWGRAQTLRVHVFSSSLWEQLLSKFTPPSAQTRAGLAPSFVAPSCQKGAGAGLCGLPGVPHCSSISLEANVWAIWGPLGGGSAGPPGAPPHFAQEPGGARAAGETHWRPLLVSAGCPPPLATPKNPLTLRSEKGGCSSRWGTFPRSLRPGCGTQLCPETPYCLVSPSCLHLLRARLSGSPFPGVWRVCFSARGAPALGGLYLGKPNPCVSQTQESRIVHLAGLLPVFQAPADRAPGQAPPLPTPGGSG